MKTSKTLASGLCAAALIFGLAGCGSSDDDESSSEATTTTAAASGSTSTTASGTATANTVVVNAENFKFAPETITVKVGTTVKWVNKDSVLHTVTSGADRKADGKFDGNIASSGSEFSYTFSAPGTYEYYCKPHANMNGTVVVTA